MKNIGLYIHIPFCQRKCNYCAFTSFPNISDDIKNKYLDKLIEEIKLSTDNLDNRLIKWIYVGGGTPNTLNVSQLEKIVEVLPKDFTELSIELNPGANSNSQLDSYSYLSKLKDFGFNRLSVGVQSFNDKELKLLGRIHNSNEAREFISDIQSVGFKNFNIDLMIGLPDQLKDSVSSNIQIASSYNPTHISAYLLSIDPGTQFEKLSMQNKLKLPKDSFLEDIYFSAVEELESFGYLQYEISNFSQKSFECKYNLNTWRNGEYIGCGLSAGNFINQKRFNNTSNLDKYLDQDFNYSDIDQISEIENFETKLLLGLRLRNGVKHSEDLIQLPVTYQNKFKYNLNKLKINGLIKEIKGYISIPKEKLLITDRIIEDLLAG